MTHERWRRALAAWTRRRDPTPLVRLLDRELTPEGVPRGLAVADWWPRLTELAAVLGDDAGSGADEVAARAERWFMQALRYSRPDGSALFGPSGTPEGRVETLAAWVERSSEPGLEGVVRRWFPRALAAGRKPPTLTGSEAIEGLPMASLRSGWLELDDVAALDMRRGLGALFELFGSGRTWLGPQWPTPAGSGNARRVAWRSEIHADWYEWRFRSDRTVRTRTIVLIHGRCLALLAEQVDGAEGTAATSWDLPPSVVVEKVPEDRALILRSGRSSARVIPIGLPAHGQPTERGRLAAEGGRLILEHRVEGRRTWLPLLVSWEPARNRRTCRRRVLTVSEKSSAVRPDTAAAMRVSWGPDDTVLIYRSLSKPGLRAFLGHQSRTRFLVADFDDNGDVSPVLSVDP